MSDLPVKKQGFLAEIETMDLSKIKDKQFMVAVAKGNPEGVKFIGSTMHGPYNFTEMLQEVGEMWNTHQHHAKVIVCEKNANKKVPMLDQNTIDYIELKYNDLITEEMLGGAFDGDYTCQAGLLTEELDPDDTDPRTKKDATQ